MLRKMDITTAPCPLCDKTVQVDGSGIIARHRCIGTWHIISTPFETKIAAVGWANSTHFFDETRVIPRRGRWIVQMFRPTEPEAG